MKIHQLTTWILHSCLVILYSLDVIKIFSLPWSLSFQTLHSIFSPFLILKTEEWNSHQIRHCNLSILTHYFFKKKKVTNSSSSTGLQPRFSPPLQWLEKQEEGFFWVKNPFFNTFSPKNTSKYHKTLSNPSNNPKIL